MSLLTIFTKTAPTINGYQFDAVLEDNFKAGVEYTTYPIESGEQAVDHGIILPVEWKMKGIVSDSTLGPNVTDFTGVISSILGVKGRLFSSAIGILSGLLNGADDTRSSQTLHFLVSLMVSRQPFDVDAGDISLNNMVITNISRTKNPENENALEFEVDMQELLTLDNLFSNRFPLQQQLNPLDSVISQASSVIARGEVALRSVANDVQSWVSNVFRF